MEKKQSWKLPAVFLLGYLTAWGSILIDRQMVMDEQRELQREVNRARKEMRIKDMVEEYNGKIDKFIIWNKENVQTEEVQSEPETK